MEILKSVFSLTFPSSLHTSILLTSPAIASLKNGTGNRPLGFPPFCSILCRKYKQTDLQSMFSFENGKGKEMEWMKPKSPLWGNGEKKRLGALLI